MGAGAHTRLARLAGVLVAMTFIAGCAVVGGWIVLRADGPRGYATAAGDLEVTVRPAMDGRVEVYVPVVDWRIESDAFRAPVAILVEARGVDREVASNALQNPREAPELIAQFQRDAEHALRSALQRATALALVGMAIGAFLGGGLVTAITGRRRWLVVSLVEAAVVVACIVAPSISDIQDLDVQDFSDPSLSGNARELPRLLGFAQQLLSMGDEYEGHYRDAVRSVANSAAFADGVDARSDDEQSVVLASDLHNNVFALEPFAAFVDGDPVVFAGDFGQVGARIERRMAPRIAQTSDEVFAVSGNHDSETFMRSLVDEGVTVMTRQGVLGAEEDAAQVPVTIAGRRVAAYDDPLEAREGEPHLLRVRGAAYEAQVEEFLTWFDELPEVPGMVIVHQHGFAKRLLKHLATREDVEQQVVILTGHDHEAHVDQLGRHVVVDGGTLGAGGPFAVGEQDASFARVRFRRGRAYAVDIAAVEPISGRAVARRVVLKPRTSTLTTTRVSTRPVE